MANAHHLNRRGHTALVSLLVLLICAALLAGHASASTPAYCQPLTKAETAVKSLPTVKDVAKHGVSALKPAISQLQQDATSAVKQTKGAFPSQTAALKRSVDTLSSTVKQLSVSSLSLRKLAQLGAQLVAVDTNLKNLKRAASSTCG
jgi:hypothetical protein